MKIKEIDRTANVAWSPASQHPIFLAAGTAAQQLDATFSTTASLEIYGLNLTEPGSDLSLKGSISSDCRFHRIAWSSHGMGTSDYPNGVIVGGADGGNLFMFDPAKLIRGEMALICQRDKHTGPVSALDFNPFQSNLLASGANESEIFIWDLNSPNSPMTPGAKAQQGEVVTCVAWNRQVQHILASTFPARCVVWDLRKNEPIIKVSDTLSRLRCKAVAWHPEVATQMCLASEDDHTPVIQLWDLRFATSPLKSLENHLRGVLSIAWCPQDPDLLLSCGKDNRILCWNPNSNIQGGEIVWELPTSNQWSFDVSWCPRNPAIVASSSFDGHVSIYSLMGGQQQIQTSSKIVDAFPGTETFSQSPLPQIEHRSVSVTLKKPPKWLRKPVGASFAFGGKLVTFEYVKSSPSQAQVPKIVYISQVVTETELISRSLQLEEVLSKGNFSEFCQNKLSTCTSPQNEKIWKFVKANFEESRRASFLNLLGYDPQEVGNAISSSLSNRPVSRGQGDDDGVDAEELALRMSALGSAANSLRASPNIAANLSSSQTPDSLPAISGNGASAFDTIASLHSEDISPGSPYHSFTISTDDDIDGLISKALLIGNVDVAVSLCIKDARYADAIILAMAGGKDLLAKTQKKYFKIAKGELSKLISSVVNEDWAQVVQSCDIKCWKEALAACLTYAKSDFSALCVTLGSRLEAENNKDDLFKAMLCYICAGNVEKLVDCWVKTSDNPESPDALQDLVELAMVLWRAAEKTQQQIQVSSGMLAKQLVCYANILAAQGSLKTALTYLGNSNDLSIAILRDRIENAQRDSLTGISTSTHISKVEPKPASVAPLLPNPSVPLTNNPSVMPILPSQIKPVGYPTPISNPCTFSYPPTSHQHQIQTSSHPQVLSHPYPVGVPPSSPTMTVPPIAPPVQTQTNVYSKGRLPDQLQFPHQTDSVPLQPKFPINSFSPSTESFSYQSVNANFMDDPQQFKGHLSQRYPTVPQDPSVNSSIGYNPTNFGYRPQISSTATYSPSQNVTNQPTAYPNFSSYNPSSIQTNGYTMSTTSQFPSNYTSQTSTYSSAYSPLPAQQPAPIVSNPPVTFQDAHIGWNDPPQVKPVAKVYKQDYEPPAPITRPIFSIPEAELSAPAPPNYQANYMPPANTIGSINAPPQLLQPAVQETPIIQAPVPEPPKLKQPIPPENQVLFDVFDNLRNRCLASATMPQIKRKLDDVARKLESLYDKLRECELSQPTILGLHQIVQAVQQGDYQSALATHAHIVSMGAFAEIGSFMPGLKILLQTSQQLNV